MSTSVDTRSTVRPEQRGNDFVLVLVCFLLLLVIPRAQAQCGVLLQEDATIPQDVGTFRSSILFDSDGPGPLQPELLVGTDKGRVFAWNGTRWRQFGPAMVDPGVTYTQPSDPQVFHLLIFRGELHAVATGYASNTNGSVFRWNGSSWVPTSRAGPCGVNTITGWFYAATVHNNEIVVAGYNLRCGPGGVAVAAFAWNGTSWRRLGNTPFDSSMLVGALYSTSNGRLLMGGNLPRTGLGTEIIAELANGSWVRRQVGLQFEGTFPVTRFQEVDGELLACGSMEFLNPTRLGVVVRETPTDWELHPRYNPIAAIRIAHRVFRDGDRTFIVGGFQSGEGAIVLLTPQGTTTIPMPYGGARRFGGGMVRYRDRYFALGGIASSNPNCSDAQGLLTASLDNPLVWNSVPTLFNYAFTPNFSPITSFVKYNDTLMVNGGTASFYAVLNSRTCSSISGPVAQRVGENWEIPTENLNVAPAKLLTYQGQPVAVGQFVRAGTRTLTTPGLALWDGAVWQSFFAPITPASPSLRTATIWNDDLIVVDVRSSTDCAIRRFDGTRWTQLGPAFTSVSGFTAVVGVANGQLCFAADFPNRIYRWTGTTWQRLGTDATTPAVSLFAGTTDLLAATTTPSTTVPSIVRWNGTTWEAFIEPPLSGPARRTVYALREFHGQMYAAVSAFDDSAPSLMRLQGSAWLPALPTPAQGIREIFPDGDILHLGGNFTQLSGFPYEWYARYYAGPPRILTPPALTSVSIGRTAYFSVEPEVYHDPLQTYQWRRNGQPLMNGTTPVGSEIFGATSPYLRIEHAAFADAGDYSVMVTNACGMTTFPATPLVVHCPADVDDGTASGTSDGSVTIEDLMYYITLHAAGTPSSDIDDGSSTGTPDGGVTIDDLLYFLQRFEAGC